jgi:DNA-binding HxlR family transcriptional regulator
LAIGGLHAALRAVGFAYKLICPPKTPLVYYSFNLFMLSFTHKNKVYHNLIGFTLDQIGGRWKMLILWQLKEGVLRYGELKTNLIGITHKMLTQQLRELEENGFISRTVYAIVPPKVEYNLTDKAYKVMPVIEAIENLGIELIQNEGIVVDKAPTETPEITPLLPKEKTLQPPKASVFPHETISQMIVPIGKLFEIDVDGCIVNPTQKAYIVAPWADVLDDTIAAYRQHYGEHLKAVYVRGSVAKGQAIPNMSDVDTLAVLDTDKFDREWRETFYDEIQQKYPFTTGVEIFTISLNTLFDQPNMRFLLKTQCLCVWGEDYTSLLPAYRPGRDAFAHLPILHKDINLVKQEIPDFMQDPLGMKELCGWIMRRIVRTGLELIGEDARVFTRDLYPCYEHFARYYPARAAEMYRALELAVFPTSDAKVISDLLNDLGIWLCSEIARKYPDVVVRS